MKHSLSLTSPFYIVDYVSVNTVHSAQQACIKSGGGIRMYRYTLLVATERMDAATVMLH